MVKVRQVAVVLYDQVDALDVTGPHDVFGLAGYLGNDFHVFTVAEKLSPLTTVSGITITPRYSLETCPVPDMLIIPGGLGSRSEIANSRLVAWIRETAGKAEIVLSVCTGALLLARAGLLEGLRVTTNRLAYDLLRNMVSPGTTVVEHVRYVDNGRIVTSGGVTAGIDAALHVVARLCGESRAMETASRLAYSWPVQLDIRRAVQADAEAIRGLLIGAAQWIQRSQGFVQWREEWFTQAHVSEVIELYDVFIAQMGGEAVGCFSIHGEDEEIWGDQFHDNAGYLHRLTVSRAYSHMGIGTRLINWAASYVHKQGKSCLRLDCMAGNKALNQYYVREGFTFCGRYDGQGWSAHLYERQVAEL